ncbi:MAG: hypothetical protein Q9174_000423 [Haloplaca sp. 1 TL-2023]
MQLTLSLNTYQQYAQELLSTFTTSLGEVALVPATGGIFIIEIVHSNIDSSIRDHTESQGGTCQPRMTQLWNRKTDGGFPETKQLKKLVRDVIDPGRDLGHVDRHSTLSADRPDDYALDSDKVKPQTTTAALKAGKGTETGVDRDAVPTAAETATAEGMVADIMSSFHDVTPSNDGNIKRGTADESTKGQSRAVLSGTSSASERVGAVVAGIASSFQGGSSVSEGIGDIGGGSGGLGIEEVADEDNGRRGIKEKEHPPQEVIGVARQECEDCPDSGMVKNRWKRNQESKKTGGKSIDKNQEIKAPGNGKFARNLEYLAAGMQPKAYTDRVVTD